MPDTAQTPYPALYYPFCAERTGQFSLPCSPHAVSGLRFITCAVDLCSGLPFSTSDKPDSIMDRFSR